MTGEGEQLTQLKTWVSLPGTLSGAVFFLRKRCNNAAHIKVLRASSWLHSFMSDSNMDDSRCLMNHLVVISEEAASKAVEIGLLGTWHLRDFRLAGSFDSLLKV